MKSHFCLYKTTSENLDFEIFKNIPNDALDWLKKRDLIKTKHIQVILSESKNEHFLIKVSKNKEPILYFLLEKTKLNLEGLMPATGLFNKISTHFMKNHCLNLAMSTFSVLYDFNFCIANYNLVTKNEKYLLIAKAIEKIQPIIEFNIVALPIVQSESELNLIELNNLGYVKEFQDFTMELAISDTWHCFEDYKADLKKKYYKRCESIRKKGNELEFILLNINEINKYSAEIYALYLQVLKAQKFVTGTAKPNHFYQLKQIYGEQFLLEGIFLKGEIVGFISYFTLENCLDIHFIGIDYTLNDEYDIYFNQLFHAVEIGIRNKVSYINFGRTSLDAKASLGAIPKPKVSLSKTFGLTKIFKNTLIKKAKSFEKTDWKNRKPFKVESELLSESY